MPTDTSTDVKKVEKKKVDKRRLGRRRPRATPMCCRLSVCRVPSTFVDAGFWGGLVGAAALGVIDPPLALFVGAGVVIARHQTKK